MKKYYYLLLSIVFLSASSMSFAQCTASFTYNTNQNSLRVNFYDNSSHPLGMGMRYSWWFGDGTASSTNQNPTYTYSAPGTYLGYFSIFDSLNTCYDSTAFYITVPGSANANCNADFSVAKDSNATFGVVITNNSSNLPSSRYYWDFGDGNSSTLRNPTNVYQNFGSYTVCLTVTDTISLCSNMHCDTLGMDSLGRLKANGFTLVVRDPISTSIEENSLESAIDVYPNPSNNVLFVDLSAIERPVSLQLLNLNAQVVSEVKRTSGQNKIQFDLSGFSEGMYFLQIDDGTNRTVKKVIKQ